MTDAPPLNGGDPSDILEWLLIQVAELREENSRMKVLLTLNGADPEMRDGLVEQIEAVTTIWFDARRMHADVGRMKNDCSSLHQSIKAMTDHAGWMR